MGKKSVYLIFLLLVTFGLSWQARAALLGWDRAPIDIEFNPFVLPSGAREVIAVEAPDTASKFRIHFDEIWLPGMCDSVVIYREDYTGEEKTEEERKAKELQRIWGTQLNFLSNAIYGQKAKVVVETEQCSFFDTFHFVSLSATTLFHRGCVHNLPSETGMDTASSCLDLRREAVRRATLEVRQRFSTGHRPWILFDGGPVFSTEGGLPLAKAAAAPEHSETNVQVVGVDEPDMVKTDGNFIYALRGNEILVYKSWPAAETGLLHRLAIDGYGAGLFLDENRLIAISNVYLSEEEIEKLGMMIRPESFTKVTVFDLSDKPYITSEWLLAGYFNRARRIDGSLRLVIGNYLQLPEIDYYPKNVKWGTPEYEEALALLEAKAMVSVRQRSLEEYFPRSYQIVDKAAEPIPQYCRDFSFQRSGRGLELTSVVTINLDQLNPAARSKTVFANSNITYQSEDNLYLASNHNWSCWSDSDKMGQYTYIHKFDTSRPGSATYLASGVVEGTLNDQFAMDEHEGFLRVAATNQIWAIENPDERVFNRVYILEEDGNTLVRASELELHAPGERIMSSRFMEDKGFVVTFRRVDPLFTLDLANPYKPQVMGELTVTGFSTYMHKLDDEHLFTIGDEVDPEDPRRRNVALSIFNVADLSRPYLVNRYDIGTRYGNSEASWEHRAFTMYRRGSEDFSYLAIPFADYAMTDDNEVFWSSFQSTLKVFKVDNFTIEEIGEVDHSGLYRQNNERRWGWWYQPYIRRGVFVDDFVYAISDAGIRVKSLDDLKGQVAEVAVGANAPEMGPILLLEEEPAVLESEDFTLEEE